MYQSSKNYKLYKNWKTKSIKRYSTTLCYWNSTSTCIKDSVWYIHQWSVNKQIAVLAHSFTSLWYRSEIVCILKMKVKSDHRSKFSNFSNWKEEAWKISGLQRDSNPWPPRYRCDATTQQIGPFHCQRAQQIDLAPNVWLHSSVGPASHQYRRGHRFESHWSPDIFQASSFQLLQLENLLRWSLFTFIYNCSTNMDFIYISHCLHIVINSKWTMFKNCKKTAIRVTVQKILEGGITPN